MNALHTLLMITACLGCQGRDAPVAKPQPVSAIAAAVAPSPHEALDKLDQRRPVPLLPMMAQHQKQNMREHLEAVQAVVAAAAVGDFDEVAASAKRLGFSERIRAFRTARCGSRSTRFSRAWCH